MAQLLRTEAAQRADARQRRQAVNAHPHPSHTCARAAKLCGRWGRPSSDSRCSSSLAARVQQQAVSGEGPRRRGAATVHQVRSCRSSPFTQPTPPHERVPAPPCWLSLTPRSQHLLHRLRALAQRLARRPRLGSLQGGGQGGHDGAGGGGGGQEGARGARAFDACRGLSECLRCASTPCPTPPTLHPGGAAASSPNRSHPPPAPTRPPR